MVEVYDTDEIPLVANIWLTGWRIMAIWHLDEVKVFTPHDPEKLYGESWDRARMELHRAVREEAARVSNGAAMAVTGYEESADPFFESADGTKGVLMSAKGCAVTLQEIV